jgi:hypothetical protein
MTAILSDPAESPIYFLATPAPMARALICINQSMALTWVKRESWGQQPRRPPANDPAAAPTPPVAELGRHITPGIGLAAWRCWLRCCATKT